MERDFVPSPAAAASLVLSILVKGIVLAAQDFLGTRQSCKTLVFHISYGNFIYEKNEENMTNHHP